MSTPTPKEYSAQQNMNKLMWGALVGFASIASTLGVILYTGVQQQLTVIQQDVRAHHDILGHPAAIAKIDANENDIENIHREVSGRFTGHDQYHMQLDERVAHNEHELDLLRVQLVDTNKEISRRAQISESAIAEFRGADKTLVDTFQGHDTAFRIMTEQMRLSNDQVHNQFDQRIRRLETLQDNERERRRDDKVEDTSSSIFEDPGILFAVPGKKDS